MPKTNKRPHEIKPEDVVIAKGAATGYDADVKDKPVARGLKTLEEAEKAVRKELAKHYPKGKEPQIFLIDSEGMWEVSEEGD